MDSGNTKDVLITGQHNKFQLKRAQREKPRENKTSNFNKDTISFNDQLSSINKLYLDLTFNDKNIYESEIKKKITSYKSQDLKKNRYDPELFINLESVIEKLVISKLKCKYCNKQIYILSNKYRDNDQWTLERINNNIGHNTDNVIISCLECNLQRKNSNMDNFEYTKKLKINKSF